MSAPADDDGPAGGIHLAARFQALALRAPEAPPGEAALLARHAPLLAALEARLRAGTGPGGAAAPGVLPRIDRPLAEHRLDGAPPGQAAALAQALARRLDGSQRLEALPRLAGLAWRAQVLLNDRLWWRRWPASDPWDAGWARANPAACAHLARQFSPRRITLVLADEAERATLAPVLAALQQRAAGLRRPLRWLWVPGP